MKQLEDNKICKYCYGCGKLELESFDGVINCKDFIKAKDTTKYYEALREMMRKSDLQRKNNKR